MMEYWVISLRGPDDVCTSDLNVLAKDGWCVVTSLDGGEWARVIIGREKGPQPSGVDYAELARLGRQR